MKADFTTIQVKRTVILNTRSIWLELDGNLDAESGQFVMAWLPGVGERPFSIASLEPLCLLVVDVGPFSHAMHQLKPGDRLWIKGPLGHGFSLIGETAILVGGGYGAAPLWSLAQNARSQAMDVCVCLGARNQADLLLCKAFKEIGCDLYLTTEDGSSGEQGLVTEVVEKLLKSNPVDGIYACGPTGMLTALASLAKKNNVPYQLSWEALMRCGMGLCGSCEVPQTCDPALPAGWLACFDGPVFRYP
jgi:dihydroorotate dehydrogenase electron transfer subunit